MSETGDPVDGLTGIESAVFVGDGGDVQETRDDPFVVDKVAHSSLSGVTEDPVVEEPSDLRQRRTRGRTLEAEVRSWKKSPRKEGLLEGGSPEFYFKGKSELMKQTDNMASAFLSDPLLDPFLVRMNNESHKSYLLKIQPQLVHSCQRDIHIIKKSTSKREHQLNIN